MHDFRLHPPSIQVYTIANCQLPMPEGSTIAREIGEQDSSKLIIWY